MKDKSAARGVARGHVEVSEASATPWLNILIKCLLVSGGAVLILAVLALIFSGWPGVGSVALGALVVVAFFGLSLLVGHIYGKKNPSGAIGVFMITYLVKVVGFAVILFTLGTPTWLNGRWFAVAAVVVVVLWQATEVVTFSRQRILLFNDPVEAASSEAPGKDLP
jgi:ATP synthase protein I